MSDFEEAERQLRAEDRERRPAEASARTEAVKPVNGETITRSQCREVFDECGHEPANTDSACPSCGALIGELCRVTGSGPRAGAGRLWSHVARKRAARQLRHEWRARCAAAWNNKHAVRGDPVDDSNNQRDGEQADAAR